MPREASRKGPRPSRKGELHGSSPSDDDVTATRILAAEPASLEATKTQQRELANYSQQRREESPK